MSKLFLVPTPIGNLQDMTLRALDVLKASDVILSEDTRRSGQLLKHFEINVPLKSFHDHSSDAKLKAIVQEIKGGKVASYITDAGMPGVSDPGFVLVREAIGQDVSVEVLPGASAVLPALVVSGIPCDRFIFEGFLPQKKGKRTAILETFKNDKRTLVFFESPYKLVPRLEEVTEILGNRRCAVARELTKKFEEVVRGTLSEVIQTFAERTVKGEIVVVIEGYGN